MAQVLHYGSSLFDNAGRERMVTLGAGSGSTHKRTHKESHNA